MTYKLYNQICILYLINKFSQIYSSDAYISKRFLFICERIKEKREKKKLYEKL